MWAAAEPLLPCGGDDHPLGCHNPRIRDRVCFEGIVIRLVTGCSWVTAERLIAHRASDTTLRARRDEWADAGVFDALADEALRAYDRIVGLDLSETAVDGSIHKAPCGGDGTGKSPVDRGKSGWKWSLLTDRNGIPVSWVADGANRNDIVLFEPTVAACGCRKLSVVAGQAAFRYSLMSPSQRAVFTTWRCLSGWSEGVGAHNSVVGADQGFRAPSGDQESVRDSVHEDSASARIAAGQRPRPSFRHPRVS